MKAKKTFRIAVIGCGGAFNLHLPGILRDPRLSLVALCDLNKNLVNQYSRRLKCSAYNELRTLLKQHVLDAVHLLTPPHTHLRLAKPVLDAGCHLLIEKPIALTYKEAQTIANYAQHNRCKLTVVHNHLFDPPVIRAKKQLQSRTLGRTVHCQVVYSLNRKATKSHTTEPDHWINHLPIKVFDEWLPHAIYTTRHFLGPLRVNTATLQHINGVSSLTVTVSAMDRTGQILLIDNTDYELFHINLYTTKALLHINSVDLTLRRMSTLSLPGTGPLMINTLMESLLNLNSIANNIIQAACGRLKRKQSHTTIIRQFYDYLSDNCENPVPLDDAIDVTKTIGDIRSILDNPNMVNKH